MEGKAHGDRSSCPVQSCPPLVPCPGSASWQECLPILLYLVDFFVGPEDALRAEPWINALPWATAHLTPPQAEEAVTHAVHAWPC